MSNSFPKMKYSSAVILSCCALLVPISHGYSSLRNVELPTLRIVANPLNSFGDKDELVLHKPSNSQLVIGDGEEIPLNRRITLECDAAYPIQFIYTGDGMPEYSTNTSQSDGHIKDEHGATTAPTRPKILFEAQLFLGYGRQLGHYDSGKYTCRSLQDATKAVHYYLFVSDGKLFVRPDGDTIYFRRSDLAVRIPCSVTHPQAVVSLQKSVNGLIQCPLNESISFEPTSGFQVKISNRFDPSGTYVCTAGHKGSYQATQYVLVSDGPPNSYPPPETIRQPCRRDTDCSDNEACLNTGHCGSPCANRCGQNTSCRTVNHHAQCKCLPGYEGNAYSSCYLASSSSGSSSNRPENNVQDPCHPFPCGQNTICESHNGVAKCSCAANYQGDPYYRCYRRSDPCNPNPCGSNSVCINRNNYASCSCGQGFIGTPPHCRAECESDYHCGHNQVCRQYRCKNPCDGACNDIPNTQCRVINRRPVCARVQNRCPSGYFGRDCSKHYEREENPKIELEKQPDLHEETISPCVPFPCGSNAECITRLVLNSVLNETGEVALCQCPPGKTGNADVECYPVDEQRTIVTHEDVRHDLDEEDDEPTQTENIVETESDASITSEESIKGAKKCGTNAIAIVSADGKSHCSCPVGFTGIASIECHLLNTEAVADAVENESNLVEPKYCDSTNTTITCGNNAYCVIINATEICQCMKPFNGNADVGCELECETDEDCPTQYTCYIDSHRCVDPCEPSLQMFFKQCGRDAYCKVENHKPVCYCPTDLPHGNPDIHCKEKSWMPNHLPPSPLPSCDKRDDKCGKHAECRTFHDSTYCVCKPGFFGDPNGKLGCDVGMQCRNSNQCEEQNKECVHGRCLDVCRNKQVCGAHAGCAPEHHKFKCICNIGTIRNPNGECEPVKGALAERMSFFRSFEDFRKK